MTNYQSRLRLTQKMGETASLVNRLFINTVIEVMPENMLKDKVVYLWKVRTLPVPCAWCALTVNTLTHTLNIRSCTNSIDHHCLGIRIYQSTE